MAFEDALKSSNGALFVQVNGPNTKPVYVGGGVELDDISVSEGDIELIRHFNETGTGWSVVGQTQSPPDPITTTITNLKYKTAGVLEKVTCPATFYAMQMCGQGVRKDVFTNWEVGLGLNVSRITAKTFSNIIMREDDQPSTKAIDISANPPIFELFRPTIGRQSITQTQNLNDIAICGEQTCGGQCDTEAVGLCDNLIVVGDTAAGSPSGNAEVYTTSNGATWAAASSDPFAVGEVVSSVVCFKLDRDTTRYVVARGTTDGANPAEIAYSDDGGATWTSVNVGSVNGQFVPNSNSMFALNRSNIWLTTDDGYVYFSDDAGESWTAQESGVITSADINAVYFWDEQNGMFAGDSNIIAKTTDGGDTWSAVTGPAAQAAVNINDVTYSGRWWIAYADGKLYYSEDKGSTWSQRTYPSSKATIPSIRFSSELVGFFVGNTASPVGTVYRTVDGGYTWETITTPTNAGLNSIVACDANLAYAVGNVQSSTAVVLKITAYPDVD